MVDFNDEATLLRSAQAAMDILFTCFGAYLWEICISFDFDLLYFRGQKRFTLAAGVYFLTRYSLLLGFLLGIYMNNIWDNSNPDCQTINAVFMVCAYSTSAFASGLLILRVRALSERNFWVTLVLLAMYAADWGLMIWQVTRTDGVFVPFMRACTTMRVQGFQVNTTMAFVFDVVCLIFMLFYTLRAPYTADAGMWKLMFDQGLAYMICIALVYTAAVIMSFLNLNLPITQCVNIIGLYVLVVCATRLHRRLITYHDSHASRGSGTTAALSMSAPKFTVGRSRGDQHAVSSGIIGVEVNVEVDNDDESDAFPLKKMRFSGAPSMSRVTAKRGSMV
ncbi:hypothetical protein BKA62DRAFT_767380 [Auriculariales sp. MPI-PUGE-AT-0066]|nr:hypothetical protein BKA62DRAFT_767380 [Auriculariales sp. MPI-PUGE-AT-0066]